MEYEKNIQDFETKLKRAEKLIFLSNFFKSKKILLSALEQLSESHKHLSVSILKFSHIKGEVVLSKDPKENKKILHENIAQKWEIEKELENLSQLMILSKKHYASPTEFMRKNKVVILDENQDIYTFDIKKLKENLNSIKKIKEIFKIKITS